MNDPIPELFGVSALELFANKTLVQSHGAPSRFPAFMRTGLFENLDALVQKYSGGLEVANGTASDGVQVPVSDVPALALMKLGVTVFFKDIKRLVAPSRDWLKRLELALGLPECADIAAFANSSGSGLPLHHDRFDQFLFHLQGKKRFRYAANRFVTQADLSVAPYGAAPAEWGQVYRHGFPLNSHEIMQEGMETLTLEPGSAFFMPAGTWHTTAEQDGPCLSIVVVVRAPSRLMLLNNWLNYYAGQSADWRTRTYGGWAADDEQRGREQQRLGELLVDLGQRLQRAPIQEAFDAWTAHGFTVGTQGEYPLAAPFERYVRLPSSSARFEDDAALGKLRCIVRSGATHRPQAETVLAFHHAAKPILDFVMTTRAAFTLSEVAGRFPDFERDEVRALLAWLAHAALIRPLPASEWGPDSSRSQ